MNSLQHECYVFDPRPRYPLVVTAKRYWHPKLFSEDPDALTVIFTHGTGFHKEQWEPTFDDLLSLVESSGNTRQRIREFWSLDCPNHGDAAALNEAELSYGYEEVFGWEEYARSVHGFLTGLGTGIPVDFGTRNLVGIGHSMGAIALSLANTFYPPLNFKFLILVEPMTFPKPPPLEELGEQKLDLAAGAMKRRDKWLSREDAFEALRSRASFKIWDPRVLKIFTEHGMRELPTTLYPNEQGVTLKCEKLSEAAAYRDILGRARTYKYLGTLCSMLPVHIIYGQIDDYIPGFWKRAVLEQACQGNHASVTRVPKAGHLIVQTQPKGLAKALYDVLERESSRVTNTSRL